ncbi:MBL fold metallo-hydrolase [Paenibacillus koleovorans]|uniref:MBL fold metallo-hydrolase n=1 Tax=Paenibacillus koleovorans TaxID=121608 RepID=UPI000FDA4463|nr:MBL fold metallo-hydrolase [Paenibacillus koleovorans]
MNGWKLVQVSRGSYMLSGPYAVGVHMHETSGTAVLIDSGPDAATAERLDRELIRRGCAPIAILHTHSHADACGGDAYFISRYPSIRRYATRSAAVCMEYPSLERGWLLETEPPAPAPLSAPDEEPPFGGMTGYLPEGDGPLSFQVRNHVFTIMSLPGHSPGMVGVLTEDRVLYGGDALFGERTLSRQSLLYYSDVEQAQQTMKTLGEATGLKGYVCYHGGAVRDLNSLVIRHGTLLSDTLGFLLDSIRSGTDTLELLVQLMMEKHRLMDEVWAYGLCVSIVQAYLRALRRAGRIDAVVEQGRLIWRPC